jgi:hypothetical protein
MDTVCGKAHCVPRTRCRTVDLPIPDVSRRRFLHKSLLEIIPFKQSLYKYVFFLGKTGARRSMARTGVIYAVRGDGYSQVYRTGFINIP